MGLISFFKNLFGSSEKPVEKAAPNHVEVKSQPPVDIVVEPLKTEVSKVEKKAEVSEKPATETKQVEKKPSQEKKVTAKEIKAKAKTTEKSEKSEPKKQVKKAAVKKSTTPRKKTN